MWLEELNQSGITLILYIGFGVYLGFGVILRSIGGWYWSNAGPQARCLSVCSGSSWPLSTMSCFSEKRRPLHEIEEVLLPPPGRGRPAEGHEGRPAQPRFKPCAQVVPAWGGQIYVRQAGLGNSRPD